MTTEALEVRLSGVEIGLLTASGKFTWHADAVSFAPLNSVVLSHCLPWCIEATDCAPFFGGLLPEGIGLDALAREARVPTSDLFGLLAEVGADVGGSVTIGEPRPPLDPIILDEPDFERVLQQALGYIRGTAVGGGGSAATGVQQKISLTQDLGGRWLIGRGSTPSTHILKPVPWAHAARIRSEAALNQLALSIGISLHAAHVESAGDQEVLVVERYDRHRDSNGTITRIHQEDATQALGLPWGGNSKYESVDSRANLKNIARLLPRQGGVFAAGDDDRTRLLKHLILNVVAGNTDAHAKNYSFLLPSLNVEGASQAAKIKQPTLADAYDVVPQTFFAVQTDPLAMSINHKTSLTQVTASDLITEATSWGVSENIARTQTQATLELIVSTVERDGVGHDAPPSLAEFLVDQATNLLRGDPAWVGPLPPALTYRK